ncbi:MAG: XdhC/CoxF family protein [Rhizobiales bacterium 65-9]|nr:XdhC family protein [Hyphomicrobiales bacterium]OJY34366.1 MAG: XdhC/CoxF family protein [Rhizobiales bacterium 65-9]
MKLSLLNALNDERAARRAAIIITDVATGAQRFLREQELVQEPWASDPLSQALADAFRTGKSGMAETPAGQWFLTVSAPPVRMIVTGAVHISQALAPMAAIAGFDVTIIDPRTAFASPERFPDVDLRPEWPDAVIPSLGLDRYSAFVALTHDPKIDDVALDLALKSDAFYIGALGSRKTHARRVERLRAAGFDDAAIARIRAPIGLNIGAVSPAEIAVSILAEAVSALRAERMAQRAAKAA